MVVGAALARPSLWVMLREVHPQRSAERQRGAASDCSMTRLSIARMMPRHPALHCIAIRRLCGNGRFWRGNGQEDGSTSADPSTSPHCKGHGGLASGRGQCQTASPTGWRRRHAGFEPWGAPLFASAARFSGCECPRESPRSRRAEGGPAGGSDPRPACPACPA
jgi:hypothetical protein